MSAAYIVLSIIDSKVEVCEAYAGSTAALGRASALAHYYSIINQDWLIMQNPNEIKDKNGEPCWIYVKTDAAYIAVHFQNIKYSSSTFDVPNVDDSYGTMAIGQKLSQYSGPMGVTGPTGPAIYSNWNITTQLVGCSDAMPAIPIQIVDTPYEDSLPGGWFYNKKPATFKDLWETPEDIVPMGNLTGAQRRALVMARIQKRPNYFLDLGYSTFDQFDAIEQLYKNNIVAEDIIDSDLKWLEETRLKRYEILFG